MVMQTSDGEWRVEVYRQPRTQFYWYRLVHGDNVADGLTIADVQRLLAERGYDMADLTEVAA
jgi:bifunctional non-homologous end joining protein LigD